MNKAMILPGMICSAIEAVKLLYPTGHGVVRIEPPTVDEFTRVGVIKNSGMFIFGFSPSDSKAEAKKYPGHVENEDCIVVHGEDFLDKQKESKKEPIHVQEVSVRDTYIYFSSHGPTVILEKPINCHRFNHWPEAIENNTQALNDDESSECFSAEIDAKRLLGIAKCFHQCRQWKGVKVFNAVQIAMSGSGMRNAICFAAEGVARLNTLKQAYMSVYMQAVISPNKTRVYDD